jgi:hypothetical protein
MQLSCIIETNTLLSIEWRFVYHNIGCVLIMYKARPRPSIVPEADRGLGVQAAKRSVRVQVNPYFFFAYRRKAPASYYNFVDPLVLYLHINQSSIREKVHTAFCQLAFLLGSAQLMGNLELLMRVIILLIGNTCPETCTWMAHDIHFSRGCAVPVATCDAVHYVQGCEVRHSSSYLRPVP